jgi:GNAT superfamily N-acetyltransferase
MTFRSAGSADALAIAALHAHSWQQAYRGILRDEFLNGAVFEDRCALWHERLSGVARADQLVLIEEQGGVLQGFACAFLNADLRWGTLLDNLHVRPIFKGQGLGRQLMLEVFAWSLRQDCPRLHLWAYERNLAARSFYERLGGVVTEQVAEIAPDGAMVNAVRYSWSDLSSLSQTHVIKSGR